MNGTTAAELQRIASTGWGYAERVRLGGWELRAAGGFTSRANCAWPIGDSDRPLAETLDAVTVWFEERGLPPRVQTLVGSVLDRRIAELGYSDADAPALRQVAPLAPAYEILKTGARQDAAAEITTELPHDYANVYLRALGHPQAEAVLTEGGADIRFGIVRDDDGTPLACGRLAIDRTSGWAGISAIRTAEKARRQGLARVVLRDLLTAAAESGTESLYLEVEDDNAAALPLYASLDFHTHHAYHCRIARMPDTEGRTGQPASRDTNPVTSTT
jgi:GNAT superfamily N-acetyltransferase